MLKISKNKLNVCQIVCIFQTNFKILNFINFHDLVDCDFGKIMDFRNIFVQLLGKIFVKKKIKSGKNVKEFPLLYYLFIH